MEKFLLYPMKESSSKRKNLAQKEWNVLSQIRCAVSPTKVSTRSFISFAALLVNVMAKIS